MVKKMKTQYTETYGILRKAISNKTKLKRHKVPHQSQSNKRHLTFYLEESETKQMKSKVSI